MSEKKTFVRQNPALSVEDLEKTVEQLNTVAKVTPTAIKVDKSTVYSYTIKLDDDLEKRVEAATKKMRQTKKGFFLSAIENHLDKLGY
jgi:hypothetical protein